MKYCFLILFSLLYFEIFAQNDTTSVWIKVEQMPFFGGCEAMPAGPEKRKCSDERLSKFIAEHLKYPEMAVEKGVSGAVVVRFVIDENGDCRR